MNFKTETKNLSEIYQSPKPIESSRIGKLLKILHDGENFDFPLGSFFVTTDNLAICVSDSIRTSNNPVRIKVFVDNEVAKLKDLNYIAGFIDGFFRYE